MPCARAGVAVERDGPSGRPRCGIIHPGARLRATLLWTPLAVVLAAVGCSREVIQLAPPCEPVLDGGTAPPDRLLVGETDFETAGGATEPLDVPFYFEVLVIRTVSDSARAQIGVSGRDDALVASRDVDDEPADTILGVATEPDRGGIAFRWQGAWLDDADPGAGVYATSFRPAGPLAPAVVTGPGDRLLLLLDRFRNQPPEGHAALLQAVFCPR